MTKRGNGEGSITKRKDGRWTARYVVHTQKGQKRQALYGKTRKEVAEKLAEALNGSRRNGGRSAKEDSVATGDFLKRWLRDCVKDSVSETTWECYKQIRHTHLVPALGI